MAGSPGAGKTEVSKAFAALLEELPAQGFDGLGKVLRIDPDDYRAYLPGYTGSNLGCSTRRSPELLKACSIGHSN